MGITRDTIFLRINSNLSRRLKEQAARAHLSINEHCSALINQSLEMKIDKPSSDHGAIVSIAQTVFSHQLEGVVLFGSVARGDNTEESDIDILIILKNSVRINRSLYSTWDDATTNLPKNISVHFVHLPLEVESQSGLWCEVSLEGIVLYDEVLSVSKYLIKLRQEILNGNYTSSYSHGHRYWRYKREIAPRRDAA